MDRIEQHHYERDHYEALRINRQIEIAPSGVTSQHIIDLNRFCDCCEDGEGYNVPKERMRDLRIAGLVEGGRFGWYKVTDTGQSIRDVWFDMRPIAALSSGAEG